MSKSRIKFTFIFMFIVSIGLLIWGIITNVQYNDLKEHGITTQAVITEITSVTYRRGHPSTNGIAVYKDENGGEHKFEGYLGDYVDPGDTVTIIYDKNNPDTVVRENPLLSMIIWIAAGMMVFSGFFILMMTVFRFDKKAVKCVHQDVPPQELTRIIQEYMPQTKKKFLSKHKSNKHYDRLGCDDTLQKLLDSGDPLKMVYDNYESIMTSGDIRLGAVIRPISNDIYSEMPDIMSSSVDTESVHFTVPVFMVYSNDDYFNTHPNELIEIANRLSGSGYGLNLTENDTSLISFLASDRSRPFAVNYRSEMTFNREVFITTVVMSKQAICNKKLSNKLFYLTLSGKYAAIIPAWYYSMWELSSF